MEPVDQFNDIFAFLDCPNVQPIENPIFENESVDPNLSALNPTAPIPNRKPIQLAQRIAQTDILVNKIHQLEAENKKLQLQLNDLKKSAQDVHTLYENEKSQHTVLKESTKLLTHKCETLDSENYKLKHENEQLDARLSEKIDIKEYNNLVVRYIKLSQKGDEYSTNGSQQAFLKKLYLYCAEKKLSGISKPQSPKKAIKRIQVATQCDLIKENPKKQITTFSVGTQCLPIEIPTAKPLTRSQATQHKNSTTTRGTTTDCFIKKHNVGTMFPEKILSVETILKEVLDWDIRTPLSPIADSKPLTETKETQTNYQSVTSKTVGTCTYVCNVQRQVDYLQPMRPIKCSTSRPPSRIATTDDIIKNEISTTNTTPPTSRRNSISMPTQFSALAPLENIGFVELWHIFGQMVLGLLQSRSSNNATLPPQAARPQEQTNMETLNQQEFNNWLYSIYETTQQTNTQQHHPVLHNSDNTSAVPEEELPIILNSTLLSACNKTKEPFTFTDELKEQYNHAVSPTIQSETLSNSKLCDDVNSIDNENIYINLPKLQKTYENITNPKARKISPQKNCKLKKKRRKKKKEMKDLKRATNPSANCDTTNDFMLNRGDEDNSPFQQIELKEKLINLCMNEHTNMANQINVAEEKVDNNINVIPSNEHTNVIEDKIKNHKKSEMHELFGSDTDDEDRSSNDDLALNETKSIITHNKLYNKISPSFELLAEDLDLSESDDDFDSKPAEEENPDKNVREDLNLNIEKDEDLNDTTFGENTSSCIMTMPKLLMGNETSAATLQIIKNTCAEKVEEHKLNINTSNENNSHIVEQKTLEKVETVTTDKIYQPLTENVQPLTENVQPTADEKEIVQNINRLLEQDLFHEKTSSETKIDNSHLILREQNEDMQAKEVIPTIEGDSRNENIVKQTVIAFDKMQEELNNNNNNQTNPVSNKTESKLEIRVYELHNTDNFIADDNHSHDDEDEGSNLVIDEEYSEEDSTTSPNASYSNYSSQCSESTNTTPTESSRLEENCVSQQSSSTELSDTQSLTNISTLLDSNTLQDFLTENDNEIITELLNGEKSEIISPEENHNKSANLCCSPTRCSTRLRGRGFKRKATTSLTPPRLARKRSERLIAKQLENAIESPIQTHFNMSTRNRRTGRPDNCDINTINKTKWENEVDKLAPIHRKNFNKEISIPESDPPNLNHSENYPLINLQVNTDLDNENQFFDCPASPLNTTPTHFPAPIEVPTTRNRHLRQRNTNLMQQLIDNFDTSQYVLVTSNRKTNEKHKHLIMRLKDCFNYYITCAIDVDQEQHATKLFTSLLHITSNWSLIADAVVQYIQNLPRTEQSSKSTLLSLQPRLLTVLEYLQRHHGEVIPQLLTKVDIQLFFMHSGDSFGLPHALNLTRLYLLILKIQKCEGAMNPSRLFIAKCIYYHARIAAPLIFEILCEYPTTLPHREERNYDNADPIITVIKHFLMCTKYDMDNHEFHTRELLSKLRFEYHFEPFQPVREEVLQNLLDKLNTGKLLHLSYAFAIFGKCMSPVKVLNEIINARLLPITSEYFGKALESDTYDARIAALLEIISMMLKPLAVDTNIKLFLNIFQRFYNAIKRPIVQEAAVQSILRLQHFGYANCFNALVNFEPTFELTPKTKAMLHKFMYHKPLYFWKTLDEQANVINK